MCNVRVLVIGKDISKQYSGIICELRNLNTDITNSVSITLPTSQSIRSIFSGSESLVALPQGCQTTIRSPWQALVVCLLLLDPILELSCDRYASALIHLKRLGYVEAAVETSLEIKKHLKRLKLGHTPKISHHLLLTTYIRILELILLASRRFDKLHVGQNELEPVVVACLAELFELRLSALERNNLHIDIKRVLLRLLANNSDGLDIHLPEVTVLLQAVLRAARSSTWNDGPAKDLKVSYHALNRYMEIANDFIVSVRTVARGSGYYQRGDNPRSRKPTRYH